MRKSGTGVIPNSYSASKGTRPRLLTESSLRIPVKKMRENMAAPILTWITEGIPSPPKVKLFDDVSFIYEAQLARMELEAWWDKPGEFRKRAAYFEEVGGEKSYHYYISGIKGKGQIGRTNQYLTHWYYPYKAKFHPQMIKAILNFMGLHDGQTVLDPFCGSGTTLVEAKTVGVNSVGTDVDPLCILMAKVKTDLLDLSATQLKEVNLKQAFEYFNSRPSSQSLENFMTDEAVPDQGILRGLDQRVYNFYLLTYLYALSDFTYIQGDIWAHFQKNAKLMIEGITQFDKLKTELKFEFGKVDAKDGDARFLDKVVDKVDGIITSPPYSIAIDYIGQDLHALEYLGVHPEGLRDKVVGLKGKGDERIRIYHDDMQLAFHSMFNVLRSGGYCATVIGDPTYDGQKLKLSEAYVKMAKEAEFDHVALIKRPILGGFARLRYEYVLIFQKP